MINAQSAETNFYISEDAANVLRVNGRNAAKMKVVMASIEMIAWFDISGTPRPIRFRHEGDVVKVEMIIRISEEKIAGNRMRIYDCQSEIHGLMKQFQLKYELNTCKWFLYKI